MAENGKTKIILTIIIGLFGVMCFGFALTVTEKYKTARDKVTVLEKNVEAGKEEVLKIPAIREEMFAAQDSAKSAQSELEEQTEELDEMTEEYDAMEEELASVKEELASVAESSNDGEEGGSEVLDELTAELESARDEVAALTDTNNALQSKLNSGGAAGSSGDASGPAIIVKTKIVTVAKGGSGTFNGGYSVDPGSSNSVLVPIDLHRGLGDEFIKHAEQFQKWR